MTRILIIEDNQNNMYLMRFMLERSGHQVLEAWTGEEGVEVAQKEMPDLILMDIQLPGIDGLETTRMIRKFECCEQIPIIAVTSYAMAGDKERALSAGCSGYIEKPINPETFMIHITTFLGAKEKIRGNPK